MHKNVQLTFEQLSETNYVFTIHPKHQALLAKLLTSMLVLSHISAKEDLLLAASSNSFKWLPNASPST